MSNMLLKLLYNNIIKFLVFLSILLLISCDVSFRCIKADDFGQPTGSPAILGDNVKSRLVGSSSYNFIQKTNSTYTGFVLTDGQGDLELIIKGAYSPWGKDFLKKGVCEEGRQNINDKNKGEYYGKICNLTNDFESKTLSKKVGSLQGLSFKSQVVCSDGSKKQNICWFDKGLGIYLGFSNDPTNGQELLYHLALHHLDNDKFIIDSNELNFIKSSLQVDNWLSIKVYLRVHDNYYGDNITGCKGLDNTIVSNKIRPCNTPIEILFLNRVTKEDTGFLEGAAQSFIDSIRGFIKTSYDSYINSSVYKNIFTIVWILFFAFMGIGFFVGVLQFSKAELTTIMLRFAVITALLSPDGWNFFNDYIVTGIFALSSDLSSLVLNATNDAVFLNNTGFSISSGNMDVSMLSELDKIFDMLTSPALHAKVVALLFSHEIGFIMILCLYFVFLALITALIQFTVIFIFIFINLTILLSLAPIFILFAVFKYTRNNYFQPWLQSLVGSAIQPIMLFVFLGLFLSIINYLLIDILYYKACWRSILDLIFFDIGFWKVEQAYDYNNGKPIAIDSPNISLIKVLVLYLSALLIRYVTDMVPKIADKISGGISIEGTAAATNKMVASNAKFIEKVASATTKVLAKRTVGRGVGYLADSALPYELAKYIPGSSAKKIHKAKKRVINNLKKKGWSQNQIDEGFKDGTLNNKLRDELAYQVAKKAKYSGPIGLAREVFDKYRASTEKEKIQSSGGKLTKAKKRSIKEQYLKDSIQAVKNDRDSDGGSKLDDMLNQTIGRQGGDADLGRVVRELADEGRSIYDSKDSRDKALKEKMVEKGYSEDVADMLIKKDEDRDKKMSVGDTITDPLGRGKFSRIKAELKIDATEELTLNSAGDKNNIASQGLENKDEIKKEEDKKINDVKREEIPVEIKKEEENKG
jgi:type IV secretory pathway VirB6-like protein